MNILLKGYLLILTNFSKSIFPASIKGAFEHK